MENLSEVKNWINKMIENLEKSFKLLEKECWCHKIYTCQNCAYKKGYLKAINDIKNKLNEKVV